MSNFRIALTLLFLSGCGSGHLKQMGGGTADPDWAQLDEFQRRPQLWITCPAQARNWGEVRRAALSSDFQHAVRKLSEEPVPEAYRHREAAHREALDALHELIATAQNGSQTEIISRYEVADAALRQIRQ